MEDELAGEVRRARAHRHRAAGGISLRLPRGARPHYRVVLLTAPFRITAFPLAILAALTLADPAAAVVAGTPASRADYPYFAVVGRGCGGTLVAADRVLTAAHCQEVVDERPLVRVGPAGLRSRVRRLALHPTYVRWQRRTPREFPPAPADFMLLDLARPAPGIEPLVPATDADGLTAPGTAAVTVGRGATAPDGSGQGTFRAGTVEILADEECAEQLPDAATRRWSLCTLDPRALDPGATPPFVSACVGDSGGPLIAMHDDRPLLVGVVSWGPACGTERDPEVYADAVVGRDFALDRSPVWAPRARGRPRITGRARPGSTVRCRVRWLVRPRRASYDFVLDGRLRQSGRRTYRVRSADRGGKLACDATGSTAGGRTGTRLSRAVRVAG